MQGLNNQQEQEYRKHKKVQQYLSDNQTIVDTYVPLKTEQDDFNDNIADLEGIAPRKTADTKGFTQARELTLNDVANFWDPICKNGEAFARKTNRMDMAHDLHHSRSQILHMQQGDVQPLCAHVRGVLTPFLLDPIFVPYGITALKLTQGMTLADAFQGKIGTTEVADQDKTVANTDINDIFHKLRDNTVQFRLLVPHFLQTVPAETDFVTGFAAVDLIDDIGVHHSGIEGFVRVKGTTDPIRGAIISNNHNSNTGKSDLTGFYHLAILPAGETEFTVTAAGYKPLLVVFVIKKGKILDLNFELEAI